MWLAVLPVLDAPSPQPWVHWVLYKIKPTEPGLAEAVHPKASPPSPGGTIQGMALWLMMFAR